jgi:Domain of unknown function (DUF4395)
VQLDVRGPRFAAAVTTVVVIAILITGNGWLALAQTVVFALSAISPRLSPYGAVFRVLVRPRIGPAREFEPAEPVRFAQAVGFVFLAVASVGLLTGATTLGLVFGAFALIAAFLNAAFGLCLGCEAYLLIRRLTTRTTAA